MRRHKSSPLRHQHKTTLVTIPGSYCSDIKTLSTPCRFDVREGVIRFTYFNKEGRPHSRMLHRDEFVVVNENVRFQFENAHSLDSASMVKNKKIL